MSERPHDPTHPGDGPLLDSLREMWDAADPAPPDLAERVLFALELEDLDTEFELLRLTERSNALAGARSAAHRLSSDATHITFAGETLTVMLAVGPDAQGGDRRRVDGWVAPLREVRVVLHTADGEHETTSDGSGRFELTDVPAGMVRMVVHASEGAPFVTPTVEI